jgi:hypothetical protein
MPNIEPLHTTVEKTTQTMLGTVVLEDPKGFPRDESNLYCVGHDGEMAWKAEKPEPSGLYSRVMLDTETETLSAYAITGQACEIELMTGKLISQVKIK